MTNKEKMIALLDEIAQKVESIQTDAIAKAEEIDAEIAKAKQALAKAEQQKAHAEETDDLEAYRTASHAIVDAQAIIDFYSTRKENKISGALLSESEYEKIVKDVKDCFEALQIEDAGILVPLLDNVRTVGNEEEEILNRANTLLYSLAFGVMRKDSFYSYPRINEDLPNMYFSRHLKVSSSRYTSTDAFKQMRDAIAKQDEDNANEK